MRGAIICLAAGSLVLLLVIGFYAASVYGKYSPVYKDIDIGSAQISLQDISISGFSLFFHLDVKVMTTNPNSYPVKIEALKQGRALLAPEFTNVGSISVIPETLPAGGQKEMPLQATIKLEGFSAISLVRRFLAGPVNMYIEIYIEAVIEENLFFTSLEIKPLFEKKCGTTLDISAGTEGGLACGDSFDDLKFCGKDDPSCDGVLCIGKTCMAVDEEIIEEATNKRDLYLGLIMGIAFSFAFLIMLCLGAFLAWQCRKRKSVNSDDHVNAERVQVVAATYGKDATMQNGHKTVNNNHVNAERVEVVAATYSKEAIMQC